MNGDWWSKASRLNLPSHNGAFESKMLRECWCQSRKTQFSPISRLVLLLIPKEQLTLQSYDAKLSVFYVSCYIKLLISMCNLEMIITNKFF